MAAWNKIVEGARDAREATIPSELRLSNIPGFHFPEPGSNVIPTIESCGLLTEPELNLTSLSHDSTWLLQQLLSQKVTSMEVVGAFCRRAAIAHQLVNCLVDYFPTVALDRARYLDAYMAEHGKPIGPLHGLPISIKGQFNLEGHDAGAGAAVIAWVGKRVAPSHAHICQILYDAGAVFYCQTATPEGSIGMECDSPLWGTTTNPLNTCLTPGGSSGGEAALIATGGSPLGVGCDSGGSLRSPAQHCGLYTIRTTERRFPLSGCNSMWAGNSVSYAVVL